MLQNSLTLLMNTPINFAKTLFSSPSIGLPCSSTVNTYLNSDNKSGRVLSWFINSGLFRGMPIYSDSYKESGDVQVGRQMLLNGTAGGVSTITDNLVVMPRKFEISGYLTGQQFSSLSAKAAATLEGMLGGMGNQVVIQLAKQYIRFIREGRVPFWFTTREGEVLKALIEKYDFEDQPEADNACKVSLSIVQFVAMELSDDGLTSKIDGNLPSVGSIFASPTRILSCVASSFSTLGVAAQVAKSGNLLTPVTSSFAALGELFGDDTSSAFDTVDDVTYPDSYVNAQGRTVDLSRCVITDTEVLNSVCDTMKVPSNVVRDMLNKPYWNTAYVADSPFSDMATEDENGETTYKEHIEVSIDFDDNSLSIVLRRDQKDRDRWWITETGTIAGEAVETNDMVVFNTLLHCTWKYGLMFISNYLPADGSRVWDDLTEEQKFDALATCSVVIGSA